MGRATKISFIIFAIIILVWVGGWFFLVVNHEAAHATICEHYGGNATVHYFPPSTNCVGTEIGNYQEAAALQGMVESATPVTSLWTLGGVLIVALAGMIILQRKR